MLSLFLVFLLFLAFVDLSTSTTEYLKLSLHNKTPFSTPLKSLSSDIHHLSLLHQRRSHDHHRTFLKSPLISGASSGSGQCFVSLRLGSPPQTLLLVADTSSDLTWVTCSACKTNCSSHKPGSTFLPRHSPLPSFSPSHCLSSPCQLVPQPDPNPCNHTRLHSPCRYEYVYSDGSKTSGFLSKETTTLNTSSGRAMKLRSLAFGCGFHVSGPSVPDRVLMEPMK
ncbi:hypothetical protein Peur_055099 [Populus x canadensis]